MDIKDMEVTYQQVKPITQKPKTKMNKTIIKAAEDYQEIDRRIKELEAKRKPLKKQLIDYAVTHKAEFDQAFQLKFPNGTYISQRVKDCIEGDGDSVAKLFETHPGYALTQLDEAAVISDARKNGRLRKLLTKLGLKIVQKESLAIYAS
ncbi:MAG: hypothetical protein KDD04_10205 [Sinomicrobium sp.]|nr:hypothetical protein [Sinomicrobium sp.]